LVPEGHGKGFAPEMQYIQVVTGPGIYMLVKIPDDMEPGASFQVDIAKPAPVEAPPAVDTAAPASTLSFGVTPPVSPGPTGVAPPSEVSDSPSGFGTSGSAPPPAYPG